MSTQSIEHASGTSIAGADTVIVDRLTDGVLDPAQPMLGPVRDGGQRGRAERSLEAALDKSKVDRLRELAT